MKLRTTALAALVAATTIACAEVPGEWEAAKKQAAAAVDSGDCASAWSLVWPWARSGNIEARAILATSMVAAGLTPPGSRGDAISLFRHSLVLAVHGAADGDRAATELLHALIRTELVSDMGGAQLKRCLDAGTFSRTCVANAVNDGFVPDFADYSIEIDATASATGAAEASCRIVDTAGSKALPIQK